MTSVRNTCSWCKSPINAAHSPGCPVLGKNADTKYESLKVILDDVSNPRQTSFGPRTMHDQLDIIEAILSYLVGPPRSVHYAPPEKQQTFDHDWDAHLRRLKDMLQHDEAKPREALIEVIDYLTGPGEAELRSQMMRHWPMPRNVPSGTVVWLCRQCDTVFTVKPEAKFHAIGLAGKATCSGEVVQHHVVSPS